jgi:hypothetical protein
MTQIRKKTIGQYETKENLTGGENFLIDDGGVYFKTNSNSIKSFIGTQNITGVTENNLFTLKNGNLTSEDIGKFVVSYTDTVTLKDFINNGGDFDDFEGALNEARLPELESFSGQTGIFDYKINSEYLNLYNQSSQIFFASIDFYDGNDWIYYSFDMRLRNFNFKLDDPYFEDILNNSDFQYELLENDIYVPANDYSYILLLNYYFINGFPDGSYDGSSNLTNFNSQAQQFIDTIEFELLEDRLQIKVSPNISNFYFQGNDRYLAQIDDFVYFFERTIVTPLINSLGPKLRRKIIGVLTDIQENLAFINPLPVYYETIPYNSFGDDNYIVNLNKILIDGNNQSWWREGFIPFVGGLLYDINYVTEEYGYYSNDALLLSATQRYVPITTNKIINPIIFIKEDYGDD